MSENNYYNYYVETLTNTMTDAIIRNVSLQASVKVNEELVKEYDETIQLLDAEIGKLNEQLENERIARNENENSKIKFLDSEVSRLNSELNEICNLKSEYEKVKHQVQHIDTFRNELLKAQKENEELKNQIEYLQLTPAKRKKVDEANAQQYVPVSEINTKDQIRDGGSF